MSEDARRQAWWGEIAVATTPRERFRLLCASDKLRIALLPFFVVAAVPAAVVALVGFSLMAVAVALAGSGSVCLLWRDGTWHVKAAIQALIVVFFGVEALERWSR